MGQDTSLYCREEEEYPCRLWCCFMFPYMEQFCINIMDGDIRAWWEQSYGWLHLLYWSVPCLRLWRLVWCWYLCWLCWQSQFKRTGLLWEKRKPSAESGLVFWLCLWQLFWSGIWAAAWQNIRLHVYRLFFQVVERKIISPECYIHSGSKING